MASIHEIIEGQRFKIEGVVRNIRDITEPELGPFKAATEMADWLNASWCLVTDVPDGTGNGRAFIVGFAGDHDHWAMEWLKK